MSDRRWDDLVAEHRAHRVGLLWLELVHSVTSRICRRYPGRVYGASSTAWSEDDIDDLVQEVVLHRLLVDGQIEYIVSSAASVNSARGIIGMHVKQALAGRVVPTQADRVAERLWKAFQRAGEEIPSAGEVTVRPVGTEWTVPIGPYPVGTAVNVLSHLPRLPNRGEERLSPVFTKGTLEEAVQLIWHEAPIPVSLRIVREICERALTALVPTLFQLDEAMSTRLQAAELSPEEDVVLRDTVETLLQSLDPQQREIVASIGVTSDAELARRLGVSRPTVIKRRQEIAARILEAVRHLDQPLQDLAVLQMQDALGAGR